MDDSDVLNKSGGQSSLNESLNRSFGSEKKISPLNCSDDSDKKSPNISRYGRARKQKTIIDFYPTDMAVSRKLMKSPKQEKSPIRSTNKAAKMQATKSPLKPTLSPQSIKINSLLLNGQRDYETNASRYNYDKKSPKEINGGTIWSQSPQKKQFKTYVRKDLIQKRRESKEETVNLMKSMFSPVKSPLNTMNVSPINSVYDKIGLNSMLSPKQNGIPENHSVVKTLDFNGDTRENKKTIFDCSTFVKKNIDVELNNSNKDHHPCSWKVGDLAWARIGSHPFWPCLVTRDPYSDMYLKKKTMGRSSVPGDVLHVTFFADSGRRGWILSTLMLPFEGLEQFEEMRDGITAEMKKKDPKHHNAFTVSQGKKRKWHTAISEAELLVRRPSEMRHDFFEGIHVNEAKQTTPKREYKKRIKSEVNGISLSESLFDSLFSSSEDSATEKVEKVRNSLDVSDVVTACLDDMATKSGNRIIQKQSHMDRWLQKAKSPQKTLSSDEAESDEKVPCAEEAQDDIDKEQSTGKEEIVKVNGVSENVRDGDCASDNAENEVVENETEMGSKKDAEISVSEVKQASTPNRSLSLRKKKQNEQQNNSNASGGEMSSESQSSSESEEESTVKRRKEAKSDAAKYDDPDFIRYVDLRKDSLMDENPHLTEDDLMAYLYKTWLYEEGLKSIEMKNDDLEQSTLVKGLSDDQPVQPKKVKRRVKREKDNTKEESPLVSPKIKPVRKRTIKTYFKHDSDNSDFEEKVEMGNLNKVSEKTSDDTALVNGNVHVPSEDNERNGGSDDVQGDSDEEYYFSDLTKPKLNLFRGLSKEKVCEICERAGNLVKCRGPCGSMFHVDCVKKQAEVPEIVEEPSKKSRGRKKKRVGKKVGRPKKNVDSQDESQTEDLGESSKMDESQNDSVEDESIMDTSTSNEQTNSEEEGKKEPQESVSHMVANAIDFESQLELKMQEMLVDDKFENCDADLDSTEDENDWDHTEAGKCEIVDVKLKSAKQDEVKYETVVEMVTCKNCLKFEKALCFGCKMVLSPKAKSEKTQRCSVPHCNKYYHLDCLDAWPQTKFNSGAPSKTNRKISEHYEALTCPRHVCHTCVCDDPRGCKTRFSGDKLARCVRCPAAYHCFTQCVPAGSQVLTASQIVCPRHHEPRPGKIPYHVNTSWCFICATGGTLICCETCPTSFHSECLNISPPEDGYICEDCETGRLPLYGELVWVKLGNYRWWPGLVLHPHEVPANILSLRHSAGEFVVRFFGAHDHYWVNRGRVFPYQEGDTGHASSKKSSVDSAFLKAVEQAQKAYTILQNEKSKWSELPDIASSLLPPHYVKLKVNKACGALAATRRIDNGHANSLTQCDCKVVDADPCGPDSDCLNRMLLTECPPTCAVGERCKNRAFERRTYPALVPYRTPHRGWGLKTLEDIRKGQFVIEYVGEIIDEAEFQRRMRRKHETRDENFYFLTLDKDRMLDAGPKGNVARFMNHSCEPNCETQKWTVNGDTRVGLFALHHIPANSEVTFNYNLECATMDKKTCGCGAKRCSGYIGVKPKQEEVQKQKKLLPAKRKYKKRILAVNSPSTSAGAKVRKERVHYTSANEEKAKPPKTEEMTEIEKDLMIIRNATNGILTEHEAETKGEEAGEQRRETDDKIKSSLKTSKEVQSNPLKRKRVSFSSEEIIIYESVDPMLKSPHIKKIRLNNGVQDSSVSSDGKKSAEAETDVNSGSAVKDNAVVNTVAISVNGIDDSPVEKKPRGRPRKST